MGWVTYFNIASIVIPLVAAVVSILTANKEKTLRRLPYFLRFLLLVLGVIITLVVTTILVENSPIGHNEIGYPVTMLLSFMLLVFFGVILPIRMAVYRLRSCGWPMGLRFMALLPPLHLILVIVLFFPADKPSEKATKDMN